MENARNVARNARKPWKSRDFGPGMGKTRTAELGNLASETFSNLRTVRAFGCGERLMETKYCAKLEEGETVHLGPRFAARSTKIP